MTAIAAAGRNVERARLAGRIGVKARPLAHPADLRPPVAQRDNDRVIGEARLDVGGPDQLPAVHRQLDDVRILPALVEGREVLPGHLLKAVGRAVDPELLREPGAHEDRIVPADLRDRIRALLEPAVVREAAVVDPRVRDKADLERLGRHPGKRLGRAQVGGDGRPD